MKPLIIAFLAFLCFSASANAQYRMTPANDTNTNATTRYITTYAIPSNSGNFSFQYIGTKVSGTVAGTVKLEGSLDGVNYVASADTLALVDQSINTKIWDISGAKRTKWRFSITTSGTTKLSNAGYYTERK